VEKELSEINGHFAEDNTINYSFRNDYPFEGSDRGSNAYHGSVMKEINKGPQQRESERLAALEEAKEREKELERELAYERAKNKAMQQDHFHQLPPEQQGVSSSAPNKNKPKLK
jgi:hypothetical protein